MRKRLTISISFLISGMIIYCLYKYQLLSKDNNISIFVRNYIPDGLWMISFYLIVVIFMQNVTKKYQIVSAFYTFLIGIMFEVCQLKGLVFGTFDYCDIIVYFCAVVIAYFIEKKCRGG